MYDGFDDYNYGTGLEEPFYGDDMIEDYAGTRRSGYGDVLDDGYLGTGGLGGYATGLDFVEPAYYETGGYLDNFGGSGYGYNHGHGLSGGGLGLVGGGVDRGIGLGGAGRDYLWDTTAFVDREMPLYNAWGSRWDDEQYALADLISWQDSLADLNEQERLRRFEDRLRWEELGDSERRLRWATMNQLERDRLGLNSGWWGRRYGNYDFDLARLQQVPLRRGLFSDSPLRSLFSRHRHLSSRYSPYLSRSALVGYGDGGAGGGYRGVPYMSRSAGGDIPLEYRDRLRLAEARASMTSLSVQEKANALAAVRRIRQEINLRLRQNRDLDREMRTDNALATALDVADSEADRIRDIRARRTEVQLLSGRLSGSYGAY